MRDELLSILEKNSRIDFKELAVLLGVSEEQVLQEITKLEKENIAGVAVIDAYGAGYFGVQKLTMIMTGEDQNEEERIFQTIWVTGENMYDRSREAILFPFA